MTNFQGQETDVAATDVAIIMRTLQKTLLSFPASKHAKLLLDVSVDVNVVHLQKGFEPLGVRPDRYKGLEDETPNGLTEVHYLGLQLPH